MKEWCFEIFENWCVLFLFKRKKLSDSHAAYDQKNVLRLAQGKKLAFQIRKKEKKRIGFFHIFLTNTPLNEKQNSILEQQPHVI